MKKPTTGSSVVRRTPYLLVAAAFVTGDVPALGAEAQGQRGSQPIEEARDAASAVGQSSLDVHVEDSKGRPSRTGQAVLWRPYEADAEAEPRRDRARWREEAVGRAWEPIRRANVGKRTTFDGLAAGEYRVSVAGAGTRRRWRAKPRRLGPTPVGTSSVVTLDGTDTTTTVTVRQEGACPLSVKVVDAASNRPLRYVGMRLLRSDGLPIGFMNSGFRHSTDAQGLAVYGALPPGTYWLCDVEKRAFYYGDPRYTPLEERIRVDVAPEKESTIQISVHAGQPDQSEIEKRWPFCVTGRVADADGNPVVGVGVRAHCGWGTLRLTGKTLSNSDGGYVLRFGPGVHTVDRSAGKLRTGLQAASIHAGKPGHYEQNLCRHGSLGMTDRAVSGGEARKFAGIVVLGKPYRLDFVVLPAAMIKGRMVDQTGRAVSTQEFWISGKELPPASSVLRGVLTDKGGRFVIGSVPLKPWWFQLRTPRRSTLFGLLKSGGVSLTTKPIAFTQSGQYQVELRYNRRAPSLTCRLVSGPPEMQR